MSFVTHIVNNYSTYLRWHVLCTAASVLYPRAWKNKMYALNCKLYVYYLTLVFVVFIVTVLFFSGKGELKSVICWHLIWYLRSMNLSFFEKWWVKEFYIQNNIYHSETCVQWAEENSVPATMTFLCRVVLALHCLYPSGATLTKAKEELKVTMLVL